MTITVRIDEDDLKKLIAKAMSEVNGKFIDPKNVSLHVSPREDFRGDSCGNDVYASATYQHDAPSTA